MWAELAYGSFLVGSYVYHRWFTPTPPQPKPADRIEIPRLDEGAPIPLIYGKCRVRSPILAWNSTPAVSGSGPFAYQMDMLMKLGIPFEWPHNVSVWRIWVGEQCLGLPAGQRKTHNPNAFPVAWIMDNTGGTDPFADQRGLIGQNVEILDGRPTQQLVLPIGPFTTLTRAGNSMVTDSTPVDPSLIPGYRGVVSVFHYNGTGKWELGNSENIGSYSYEVASYPGDSDAFNIGDEANPAKVLRDLLVGKFGKLGLPTSKLDLASFGAAKIRLAEEGNGYSRAIETAVDAREIITEIERQIDGVVFENPKTGLIKIKLIRDDYDPNALLGITIENCERLENFAAGGFESVVNKVRVIYNCRADDYREGSATAHNQATAAGQNGEVREALIRMPGVCTQELANAIAARELAARSRPIAKCRAIVDRTFDDTMPGDPVRVTWPEYGIDGRVFRVAAVNRGTLENGKIALELIEDFFYVWRNVLIPGHPVDAFPGFGDVLIEE